MKSFADALAAMELEIPPYTQAQQDEDDRQLQWMIGVAVLQREVAENLATRSWLVPAAPECSALLVDRPAGAGERQKVHERAADDLTALCELVIRRDDAEEALLGFVEAPGESQGALVFACLLQLGGYVRNARFWWSFAAGAGDTTAAYCLFLDGLLLDRAEEAVHCYESLGGAEFVHDHNDDPPQHWGPAFGSSRDLAQHIEQVSHEDFGVIALPGPGLPADVGRRQTSIR